MFCIYIHLISEFDATTDNNSIYWFVKNIRVYCSSVHLVYTQRWTLLPSDLQSPLEASGLASLHLGADDTSLKSFPLSEHWFLLELPDGLQVTFSPCSAGDQFQCFRSGKHFHSCDKTSEMYIILLVILSTVLWLNLALQLSGASFVGFFFHL